MKRIFEQISKIREAQNNNKLIIFVGAGVSANSNLPSWGELIKMFATEIGYATNKYTVSIETEHFCPDEYLKIPQYVYNKDKNKYYEILHKTFDESALSDVFPNKIHEIILQLSPAHIITTNYDSLIEKSQVFQEVNYTVISSDTEMLRKGRSASKYIIKMHGDNKSLCEIVLKEDDYLRYEQSHILLSTFIKSLLVSHTFLFIGYSLNDYNFKQIIDWIEYLAERAQIEKENMTTHYIVRTDDSNIEDFEDDYLINKHISILSSKELGDKWIDSCVKDSGLQNSHGCKLYATLKAIIDDSSDMFLLGDFETMIMERYKNFDDFNFIPYQDLLHVYNFKDTFCEGVILKDQSNIEIEYTHLILNTLDNEALTQLNIIANNPEIRKYFQKAHIWGAVNRLGLKQEELSFFNFEDESIEDINDVLFNLYITNDYIALYEHLKTLQDKRVKAYWLHSLNLASTPNEIADMYQEINDKNYDEKHSIFWRLVDKSNWLLLLRKISSSHPEESEDARNSLEGFYENLSEPEKNIVAYLYNIISHNKTQGIAFNCLHLMENIQAEYDSVNIFKTDPWDRLKQIFKDVFCYYKFIKYNYIILDKFKETKDLFWSFSRAILYTYRVREPHSEYAFIGNAEFPQCPIDIFTLDIIVKYSNHKDLLNFIQKNNLKGFMFSRKSDIAIVFNNLCKTFMWLHNEDIHNALKNFAVLLSCCNTSSEVKKDVMNSVSMMLDYDEACCGYKNYFVRCLSEFRHVELRNAIANLTVSFAADDNFNVSIAFLRALEKTTYYFQFAIYIFNNTNNLDLKQEVVRQYTIQSKEISETELYNLCLVGLIDFDDVIKDKLFQWACSKVSNGGIGYSVNEVNEVNDANQIIIWLYLNEHISINDLRNITQVSGYLRYIIDFDNFNVINIDTSDFLWIQILENKNLHQRILSDSVKKKEIESKLINRIDSGRANDYEKKIYWKFFEQS